MSLTRTELATRVRRMLSDYALPASARETADGVTNTWILPDRYIDPASLRVYKTVDTVVSEVTGTSQYSFNPDNSASTFTPVPEATTVLDFTYTYTHWAEDDIIWALADAVHSLAPNFYVRAQQDLTYTDERRLELADPSGSPVLHVSEVLHSYDGTTFERLVKHRHYRVERGEADATTLVFFSTMLSGTLRANYTLRAEPFTSASQTLADLGLPERTQRALVLYATWTLLEQRIIPRMRSDIAVVTQGEGVPTPYMLLQHSARIKALLDLELERQKMPPQNALGV